MSKLCATKGCRNAAVESIRSRFCHSCRHRQFRAANPLKAKFSNLRKSAKRRGIAFLLTFVQFEAFALSTGYAENSGRHAGGLTIDRVDPTRGYEEGNLQAIPNRDNAAKQWLDRRFTALYGVNEKGHAPAEDEGVPASVDVAQIWDPEN
jgi:hypothetical protein